nr:hypothetical protein [uncultured Enterobacter sp.]
MATNLIKDGQFNPDITDNWIESAANLVSNPSETNTNYYCHLEATGRIEQNVQHTPGTTYVFSFSSRSDMGGTVLILDPTVGTTFFTKTIPASADWAYSQFSVTAETDWPVYVAVNFEAPYNGTFDVDNVIMQESQT